MEGDVPAPKDMATLEEEHKEKMVTELIKVSLNSKSEKEATTKYGDTWRSDLTKVSSLRWYGKAPENPEETLTLRYKAPEWPHQKPLWHMLTQIPKLTCLILDRSEIRSLRELGSSLQSLVMLSIANCGLSSLDGAFAFPNLRTLIAPDNKLANISQCSYLEELQHLDLCANPISNYDAFYHLSLCTNLRSMHLNGTPVSKNKDFQTKVKSLIPQLKELYPGGYRESPEEEAADLETFLQRNRSLIGSSYEEMDKSTTLERWKKKRKNKESETVEEQGPYQDVPPEGLEKTLQSMHFPSTAQDSERTLSATSVWSIATSEDLTALISEDRSNNHSSSSRTEED